MIDCAACSRGFSELSSFVPDDGKPDWAREVIRLRRAVYPNTNLPLLSSLDMRCRLQVVKEIVRNFEPNWRIPLAIYFAALIGSSPKPLISKNDNVFFETLVWVL